MLGAPRHATSCAIRESPCQQRCGVVAALASSRGYYGATTRPELQTCAYDGAHGSAMTVYRSLARLERRGRVAGVVDVTALQRVSLRHPSELARTHKIVLLLSPGQQPVVLAWSSRRSWRSRRSWLHAAMGDLLVCIHASEAKASLRGLPWQEMVQGVGTRLRKGVVEINVVALIATQKRIADMLAGGERHVRHPPELGGELGLRTRCGKAVAGGCSECPSTLPHARCCLLV